MKRIIILITFMGMTVSMLAQQYNPDFLKMVEYAIKAPSGHNTQPWIFKLNENSIEIHPNLEKALPVVDPDNRELFISLGCALENLCITASTLNYKPHIDISDTGLITVTLQKQGNPDNSHSLFDQIPLRQTNRSVYDGRMVPKEDLDQLLAEAAFEGIGIRAFENGSGDFALIKGFIVKGNSLQMTDKEFKKELKDWMRFNKKHSDATNNGLSYAVFGAPNLPRFISKPAISMALNEKSQNKGDIKKIDSSSHLVLFTTANNTIGEWITLGRSLQRFLLKSTEQGIVHSYFNQPNELPSLAEEMTGKLGIEHEHSTVLIRIGYGEKMPYSKRQDVESVIR